MYGPPARVGRDHAKSIVEIGVNPETGMVERSPEHLIQYHGRAMTTVLGLAEGPDGLYFTDFFGETPREGDPTGNGAVWKVIPSEATAKLEVAGFTLPGKDPIEKGQALFARNCATCHQVAGIGGHEGPELTHAMSELDRRLHSSAYVASVQKLLKSNNSFLVEQRGRLKAVLDAKGRERIQVWLRYHLEEPRFDNTYAKMPSFALLSEEDRDHIIAFVNTLK
jgi:cytochrome c2